MSTRMRLDQVELVTPDRNYTFDFRDRCTILDGPVGTGKSSLLELIKHVLGGTAILTPAIRDNVQRVHASIRCNDVDLRISRGFGREGTTVSVDFRNDGHQESLPLRPRAGTGTFSDTLLSCLEIPMVRIPRSRTRSNSASVPITYNDILSYQYVEQQEIDRSIVHHTESFREPKRRAAFELMFGILDPEQLVSETELGQVKDSLRDAKAQIDTISTFLGAAKVDDESVLTQANYDLTLREERAASDLSRLREEVEASTQAHAQLRARVAQAEEAVRSASENLSRARHLAVSRQHLLAQLHVDADRGDKAASASTRLGPLEFVSCPRCLQAINEFRASAGECILCLQPTIPRASETTFDLDVELEIQVDELSALLQESLDDEESARHDLTERETTLAALRAALDRATGEAVAPRFQEIELLSAERAQAIADRESVKQNLNLWGELRSQQNTAAELEARVAELNAIVKASKSRTAQRQATLDDLSDLFAETVQHLEIPWAYSAHIDKSNYLPYINNEPFDTVAVAGGTKTVICVAYHLTLLSFAVYRNEILLPDLLILDTPRKNLGGNPSDAALGSRIYRRIQTILGATNRPVQLIIADNDPPANQTWARSIHFEYDYPLLADVPHPGEAAALSGALQTVESFGRPNTDRA